jgi:MtrB/PioB family decaheme-associated outer membrane protein
MKVRGNILPTGILSITVGSVACYAAMAAEPAAEPEQQMWPAAITDEIAKENGGVKSWGDIEFGGRYFIQRPSDIGRAWVTPSLRRPDPQSIAKFEEYGNVPEGFYFERLNIGGQTKDSEYFVDLRASDVANNNQRYIFDWGKTGVVSGTMSWDQIPHVYSTSAQNIWNGVGTTYLTTPIFATLAAGPNTANGTAGTAISNAIKANGVIKLGIERDKLETDNRWTPTPNWEFRGTYSTERREGTQISGVAWSGVGNPTMVQVPRPVADTTQNGKASAERMGEWAYGKYNIKVTGAISTFDNDYSSFVVQNPFTSSATPANGCASTFTAGSPPCARISLMPSNQAYTGNITSGIDLPFHSRFMNTVQYTAMRQDEPFLSPTVDTGGNFVTGVNNAPTAVGTIIANSAYSLNGEVNALLVNNVLTTQLTPDLKSSLRYRYYDNDNVTPRKSWNWVSEDNAAGVTRTNFGYSYTKQNASEDLTYHIMKNTSVGGSAGWERIDRDGREALRTDEYIGKLYGDSRWNDVGTFRASYQYSERRYDRYDPQAWYSVIYPNGLAGASNNWGERKFDLANRDRDKVTGIFTFDNIPFVPNLALSPSFGLRNDHYLTDPGSKIITNNIRLTTDAAGTLTNPAQYATSTTYEMGLLKDNSWNGGIEAAYTFKPGTSLVLAYVHENFDKDLTGSNTLQNTGGVSAGCIGNANINAAGNVTPCANIATRWGSNMKEDVDTLIVGFNVALNDQFDFTTSYSIAFGKENWTAYDMSGNSSCAAAATAAGACAPFPTVNTNLQRVDAVLKYKFDSETVTKLGFEGDVYWKLKYSWDHMRVDNWQNDLVTPYMYYLDSVATTTRSTTMAAYNPNYDIHAVSTSINLKW